MIPPSRISEVQSELLKIKRSAKNRFSLELRVGVVPVKFILDKSELKVAKYQLSKGRSIAKFTGGGLEYADKLIKSDSKYLLSSNDSEDESSFDRISCRWNPIKSQEGKILTLMIKAEKFIDYKQIQVSLNETLGDNESKINPVKPDLMSYRSLKSIFKSEKGYESSAFSLTSIKRFFEIIVAYLIFGPLRSLQPKFLSKYTLSMKQYSDFRKFDDVLRMVIDCTQDQIDKILLYLKEQPNIKYGYSCSDHALMTCLVFGLDEGEHIHFIDGADGGYNAASQMIKKSSNELLA